MRRRRDRRRGTPGSRVPQSDLFAPPPAAGGPGAAVWWALPQETRQALTGLVARLLLQHGGRARRAQEAAAMTPDKIKPHHLARRAIVYVRQSSAHQVLHNPESRALQYAMRDRLAALGWSRDRGRGRRSRPLRRGRRGPRRLRADGRRGLPGQGGRGGGAGGVALRPQQPRLAAADRDVPGRRHGAGGRRGGLRPAGRQRPPAARAQGQPERVRARPAAAALAIGPLRQGAAGRTGGRRPDRLRQGRRSPGDGSRIDACRRRSGWCSTRWPSSAARGRRCCGSTNTASSCRRGAMAARSLGAGPATAASTA